MTRSFGAQSLTLTTEQHAVIKTAVKHYGAEKMAMLSIGKVGSVLSLFGETAAGSATFTDSAARIGHLWVCVHLLAQVFGERMVKGGADEFLTALEAQLKKDGHL